MESGQTPVLPILQIEPRLEQKSLAARWVRDGSRHRRLNARLTLIRHASNSAPATARNSAGEASPPARRARQPKIGPYPPLREIPYAQRRCSANVIKHKLDSAEMTLWVCW